MNYTTLVAAHTTVGSIQYHVNYSRIDSAGILEEAQAWIYAKLRVRQMISTSSVTISSGATTAAFPTGYLDPLHFGIPGVMNTIRHWDVERFRTSLGWDESAVLPEGIPTVWTDHDTLIQLNTRADQAYTAKMVHYKTPTALSGSNLTNWLTDKYPTLVRRACLMFAYEARKELEMMNAEEARALQQIQEINVESDLALRGMEMDMNWESY